MAGDRYHSFADLAAHESEGRDFRITVARRASPIAIIAPHGGNIEVGTSELARAIARADFSLYCFEGLKIRGNGVLHITSTRFDEPRALDLIEQARCIVTLHGCEDSDAVVYIGGLDHDLKNQFISALAQTGFDAREDNSHHAGNSPRNLCNKGKPRRGVQFEISWGLRCELFAGLESGARQHTTPKFDGFMLMVRQVLLNF